MPALRRISLALLFVLMIAAAGLYLFNRYWVHRFDALIAREAALRDPERNIQVGCWYLEKIARDYRDTPGAEARVVAGYNAGPSRAAEWNRVPDGRKPLTSDEFVSRIDFPTTRAYVSNILERYRKKKA